MKLIKDVTAMYAEGGSRLAKFVSNGKGVLVSIPKGEKWKDPQDQKLRRGTLSKKMLLAFIGI